MPHLGVQGRGRALRGPRKGPQGRHLAAEGWAAGPNPRAGEHAGGSRRLLAAALKRSPYPAGLIPALYATAPPGSPGGANLTTAADYDGRTLRRGRSSGPAASAEGAEECGSGPAAEAVNLGSLRYRLSRPICPPA